MTAEQMQRSAAVYSCAGSFNRGFELLVKRQPQNAALHLRAAVGQFARLGADPLLAEHLRERIVSQLDGPHAELMRETLVILMPAALDACVELLIDASRHCEAVKLKDKIGDRI